MKKLIKLTVLVAVLAIFAFSSNPTITKVRTFVVEKGKVVYADLTQKTKESENEKVSKFGEIIE
jgi:hypothetical protein